MTSSTPTTQALDGASIDGGLYGDITDFARHTHWLNGPVSAYTSYGVALFAVFMLVGWWYRPAQGRLRDGGRAGRAGRDGARVRGQRRGSSRCSRSRAPAARCRTTS